MSYLSYVSDQVLIQEVKYILDKSRAKKESAKRDLHKNVIDPFGAAFEAIDYQSHDYWVHAEIVRQTQKTIQNHVGAFHQKILGSVEGWKDLGTGAVVDLVNEDKKIIAEIKNKHNTVTGGSLSDMYYSLSDLISPKHSSFKGYTAYFVNIVPKTPKPLDRPFTPSDKSKGEQCAVNENIRQIDGASFYHLVTGQKDALKDLFEVLPKVIDYIYQEYYNEKPFIMPDQDKFRGYFSMAYE